MKVGRRLGRIGTIALKNSVYVLPKTEGAAEDVVEANVVSGISDEALESKARRARRLQPATGELRFDMAQAEYSHEDDACTFEVLCSKFRLNVPGLRPLAEIVHDIEVNDRKFERKETAGIAALIDGVAALHREDDSRLRIGAELLDALLSHFASRKY